MKTPHKHAELIKAWADGAEIEMQHYKDWKLISNPRWDVELTEYRIKPEPKPDVVRYGIATAFFGSSVAATSDNIKVTFDGETGKLKSAEVIS